MFSLFTTAVSTGHSKFSFERVSLMTCNTLNLFWVQKFGAKLNKNHFEKKLQKNLTHLSYLFNKILVVTEL